jgi:hypothetical protein
VVVAFKDPEAAPATMPVPKVLDTFSHAGAVPPLAVMVNAVAPLAGTTLDAKVTSCADPGT